MPITKEDIQGFGDTLRNTLAIWGEQIQQGRDYAKLKKVQNQLANVKNFTTDANGNPLGYEDITKKMMGINSQLSDIRTPEVMKLAQMNVSDFVTKNIAGLTQDVQNRFDVGMYNMRNQPANTKDADRITVDKIISGLPRGMYKFSSPTDKSYAPRIINKLVFDENGNIDKNRVQQVAIIADNTGKLTEVPLGDTYRNKLTVEEQLALKEQEYVWDKDIRSTPTYSNSSSYNYSTGDRPTSFRDESTGKVTNLIMRGNKLYNLDGTPVSQEDARRYQSQTPISENITPKNETIDNETSYKRLKQMLPDIDNQNSVLGNVISRWISADANTEESVWNEIHAMFPNNNAIRDLIWDLKKGK